MTRAWIALFHGEVALAFSYHPLFWMVPLIALLVAGRWHVNKRLFHVLIGLSLALMLGVWIARLLTPSDMAMLHLGPAHEDVVSIGLPQWFILLRSFFAT